MKTIKRYEKYEALKIIHKDDELEEILKELQDDLINLNGLSHRFEYGDFFSPYDSKTNSVDMDRVVIRWCSDGKCNVDDFVFDRLARKTFDQLAHKVIADSLEEAIVIMRDIENANGKIIESEEK